ncbi:MAG: CDP-alcohol phosphatidyltransferase family protein [Bryobacteraceae bacterium]
MRWCRDSRFVIRYLPNLLSLARLAAAPFVIRLLMADDRQAALWLFVAAGLTDGLDGFLARRLGAASRAGSYLDPIADKILLSAIFLAFGIGGRAPVWLVAIVFGRDLLMLSAIGAILLCTNLRAFPPTLWGKLSTLVQIVFVLAVLAGHSSAALVWITAIATAWSGAHYFWTGIRMIRRRSLAVS